MTLNNMLDLAFKTPMYAELYKARGIARSDIQSMDDLTKLPTVSKANLVKDYTKAIAKPEDVFKYHTTSGTSGTPTVVAFTQNDWDIYVEQNKKCLQLIGTTKKDKFYNATPYGMFFAGLVLHDAAIRMGAQVIPAGTLSSINAHFNLLELFNPTVFIGIPQYLFKMGNVYADTGKDPRDLSLKKAYCLGEPLPNKKREIIEDLFDIEVFCGYGLSEIGAGAECCEKRGFHWPIEDVHVEMLNEHYGKGELVYTTLKKTGTLAIRFRSRDLGYIIDEPCSCGDKSPLISHIEERIDDLVKIKGTLISPYAIEEAIYSVKGVKNYLFIVDDDNGLDTVSIYIEGSDINEEIIKDVINGATFITPKHVKLVPKDSIPIIGRKIRRFYDFRKGHLFNNTVRKFMKEFQ